MKTFIDEVVESLGPKDSWVDTTVIFPNRRAGLFFKQAISKPEESKPFYIPEIYSMEDFIYQHVPFRRADPLTLISILYRSYTSVFPNPDPFADFFFWGKMILRDFDDLDQHMADVKSVFTIVEQQKQLDLGMGFLSAEQLVILSMFWKKFTESPTSYKEQFINIWKKLTPLYDDFQLKLKQERFSYKGMAYRLFISQPSKFLDEQRQNYIFAGFNALTTSEEKIIAYFIKEKKAKIIWDLDRYYIEDKVQEAGRFLREHLASTSFKGSFPIEMPARIRASNAEVIGVPFRAGQAKYVGQEIEKLLNENPQLPLHRIAVVLPDEQLLFSVLNALPSAVQKFNVTMGFPVETTPIFSLLLQCMSLQEHVKPGAEKIYYRPVKQIFQHPIIHQITEGSGDAFLHDTLKFNRVYLKQEEITSLHPVFKTIFKDSEEGYTLYLMDILNTLMAYEEKIDAENYTALNFIKKQLVGLQAFESELKLEHNLKNFTRFLRQLLSSDKIPFEGEPLQGLQIMGVLETRNLDFEYVFVLSLNEDFFPADSRQKSYIPYNIRKAFDLPVFDNQDAIYAYLFYRLFQRSKKVTLLYNTEGNVIGGQEMSRFLQQLLHEKPFPLEHKLLNTPVNPKSNNRIFVEKDALIMDKLNDFLYKEDTPPVKWLYPSTIFSYLFCRLQFYFKYVARLKEAEEMDDEVDARLFGNILHDCMEELYNDVIQEKQNKIINASDFEKLKKKVPLHIEKGFKKQFNVDSKEKFEFNGLNIVQREILIKFINQILDYDKKITPFEIIALETSNEHGYEIPVSVDINGKTVNVGVKGKIDRLDKVNGSVRVIDYKTGGDELEFSDVGSVFERDAKKANKAIFQTLFYSFLYINKHSTTLPVVPGLYSRKNLFTDPYDYRLQMKDGKSTASPVVDYRMVQQDYEEHLNKLLKEIFDPQVPFSQTDEISRCTYCAYHGICQR